MIATQSRFTPSVTFRPREQTFAPLLDQRILVVDNHREVAALVKDAFEVCGAVVTVANSGAEVIGLLGARSFDLVILDLVLPGQSGWDVLRFIEQDVPHMLGRILFLTGDHYDQGVIATLHRSRIPCLFKPCGLSELRAKACAIIQSPQRASAA